MVNPFVNPNQRSAELPPTCKDLSDVLSKFGALASEKPPQFKEGRLGEVRTYVRQLYQVAFSRQILFMLQWQKSVLLMVRGGGTLFKLELLLRRSDAFVCEAIAEIFGEEAQYRPSPVGDLQTVCLPLPESAEDSAQTIIDFLLRAYDISDDDKFIFSFQDQEALPPGSN